MSEVTMTLFGHVQDGRIVFEPPVLLPEGVQVRVEVVEAKPASNGSPPSLLETLGDVVGAIDDLPEDFARNHDHYLYGTPKRS
jgi:hypothetical protein